MIGEVHPGQVTSPSQGNTDRTNNHTHSSTSKGNVERPINLTVMFLDCGRKPEYPERTHKCKGRTFKLHAERATPGVEPWTFLLLLELGDDVGFSLRADPRFTVGLRCGEFTDYRSKFELFRFLSFFTIAFSF
ncbi:hypothetical protein AMECASPLE_008506 [Ameca splendens]|uniref:Uncharacterized protein n=1 Tax=Ameca splendens TaxID=208324 RepID=A0ABV0Z8S2_9TELE